MKKFLIIMLAAFFCLAFALPAMAKVRVGGMITWDYQYRDISSEAYTVDPATSLRFGVPQGGSTVTDGWNGSTMRMPWGFNRFEAYYSSDDEAIKAKVQIRGGGTGAGTVDARLYDAWIMWQISPGFRLQIGRIAQTFSSATPPPYQGHALAQVFLIGFGNVHISNRDQIKAHINFSDATRLEIALVDPGSINQEYTAQLPAIAGANVDEESIIPRIDLALNLKLGNWTIEPALTYLNQTYDQVATGSDDDVTSFGASIWLKAGFGNFILQGELNYGENLGTGNYTSALPFDRGPVQNGFMGGPPVPYVDSAGNVRIEDGEMLGFWIAPGFKMGAATIFVYFGYEKSENDVSPGTTTDDLKITQKAYGISVPISITKGFSIRPEFTYYDFDDSAKYPDGTNLSYDRGNAYSLGVQFMLVF
jgi:hypothetical protein